MDNRHNRGSLAVHLDDGDIKTCSRVTATASTFKSKASSCCAGSSSNIGLFSSRRRFDLSYVFLIWLCISLALSATHVQAQDQVEPPSRVTRPSQFDLYFEDTATCTVHGGECCTDMSSIECQGWFCIEKTCAVLQCAYCTDEPDWVCGPIEGVTRNQGLGCKHRAFFNQPCNNKTLPCENSLTCSSVNNTCQYTPELWKEYQEEVKSRRITMAGMIVVLIGMFVAMRRMLKNEEARRRQIWEPVDSSAEASILRRLAEDTQRRVTGGWGQISESLVEGGNAATAAMGTAFTRIRNNVRNATGASGRPEDCDDPLEMLPSGRRAQTRRELEADMRDFLLEGDEDDDEDEDEDGHNHRDEDGLLARHRSSSSNSVGSGNGSGSNTSRPPTASSVLSVPTGQPSSISSSTSEGFPDEPPSYDEIRPAGGRSGGPTQSIAASLSGNSGNDTLV